MNCPICEQELTHLTRPKSAGTQHFFCETCEVEFYVYPPDNKDALQRTGWYAHIPLKNYPEAVWKQFLRERITDGLAFLHRKWQERVGGTI